MKIYFYDGRLNMISVSPIFQIDLVCKDVKYIDAGEGPKRNIEDLDSFINTNISYIFTNSLIALSHKYGWNEEENHTDIYLWVEKQQRYVRIDELTNKDIRYAHNIEKMYIAGVFDVE